MRGMKVGKENSKQSKMDFLVTFTSAVRKGKEHRGKTRERKVGNAGIGTEEEKFEPRKKSIPSILSTVRKTKSKQRIQK